MTFCDTTIYNDNSLLIRLCIELDLLPNFERSPENICDECGMPTMNAYSSGHLLPSLWDLHIFYLLRPILFFELVITFPDYALRISLGTFSILLNHIITPVKLFTLCLCNFSCSDIAELHSY